MVVNDTLNYTVTSDPPLTSDELSALECADSDLAITLIDDIITNIANTPHSGSVTPSTLGTHLVCIYFTNSLIAQIVPDITNTCLWNVSSSIETFIYAKFFPLGHRPPITASDQ